MSWPSLQLNPEVYEFLLTSLIAEDSSEEAKLNFLEVQKAASIPPLFTTLRWNTLIGEAEDNLERIKQIINDNEAIRCPGTYEIEIHPVIKDCIVIKNQGPVVVKPVNKEVTVDHACGMAILRGSDIFVPGILSMSPAINFGDVVSVYVDPDGGCLRGQVKKFTGNKCFLGNGTSKVSRTDVFGSKSNVSGVGIVMTSPIYRCPRLSNLPKQLLFPQNLTSIVCSHVLQPQSSDFVLDMCCAPGGKTSHIGTIMKNMGRIVAVDKSKNKINKVLENLKSWSLTNVEVYCHNSIDLHNSESELRGPPPYPCESFDKILLDAPCSALGQRPTMINKMALSQLKSHSNVQRKLISTAVKLLKRGGTLVYSTCTSNILENEVMVEWTLSRFPELQLSRQVPHVGGTGRKCRGLSEEQLKCLQTFQPTTLSHSSNNDTIGFFIAKFTKI